jgi:uncharacterized protein YegP (UPF0339 family)/outer membrane protein OmpA-like peptidoglycan-associated protein
MRYRAFRRKKDDLFYFQFLSEDNNVLLNSQAYTDKEACFNGIRSVINNANDNSQYEKSIDGDGKHFFILKARNGQEIGRSVKYDTENKLDEAINSFVAEGAIASSKDSETDTQPETKTDPPLSDTPSDNKRIYKDYKPLSFYEENIVGTEFGFDPFEKDNFYYFTLNQETVPVLISEDYTSEAGRDNGISSVKKNVKKEKRYERMVHPNGMHYFNLLAGNKQEIATSRWFESKKEMEKAIYWLMNTGGTRKRKKAIKSKQEATGRTYIDQGQPYLCNNITYDLFQSGGNQRFYFVFKDKDEKAVLINGNVRGFATQEDLEKGIKEVFEFAPKNSKYDIRSTKNGKPYFYIQNDKGKNIARSSLFYKTEEEMRKAMSLIQCVGATMVGAIPATTPKQEAVIDDYLPHDRYQSSGPGFNQFYAEDRKEYYFSYNDTDGNVLLRSEGYTTEAARDKGIASVEKNAPLDERWAKETALNGKYHYYILKAGNHKEIARSSYHDNEADMFAAFALTSNMLTPKPAAAAKPETVDDDYLPCKSYAGESGFHTFTNEENGEHYFAYNRSSDNKTMLRSEGYTQTAARDNGIQSVIKNSPLEERWATGTALNDKYHYYYLKAGNNREIARSCYYDDQAAMIADLNWLQGEDSPIGFGSAIVGGTLLSAGMLRMAETEKLSKEKEAQLAAKAKAEEEEKLVAEEKAKEEKAAADLLAVAAATKMAADAAAKEKEEEAEIIRLKEAADAEALRLVAEEEKAKAAAIAAAAAAVKKEEALSTASTAYAGGGGDSEKSGCMSWIVPAIIALVLIALLLFLFKDCLGCKKPEVVVDPPIIEKPIDTISEVIPDSYGRNGEEMGYKEGSLEYLMANHLESPSSTFPSGKFDADAVTFGRNASKLNAAAKKQLDNVIALLKEYPTAKINIFGYVVDKESGSGNKETSLDDDRAGAIYNYLQQGGIDFSRMTFQGEGLGDRRGASISILSR